ncbi:hypothetical protein RKE29_26240 [Streptomyces sp. B1866]|uniref:hypothetical protein n=1 Tax=Streptomyces sp. B1866 TaxID=3075431 RepID=UPI00288F84E2|nr:hypothetical protein [Streptomyces sp. B1866]MDT3400084.1 hypothetical protein [Streptomyces sp. B1866]
MAAERVWVISCDRKSCKGRVEVHDAHTLEEARAHAAAVSGWKSDRGIVGRVLVGSTAPQDICPACARGRTVHARGQCPHCGGLSLGMSDKCFDCGRSTPRDEQDDLF